MHFSISLLAMTALALRLTAALSITATTSSCLTDKQASTLATNFGLLVSAYSQKLANQTLDPNFLDYSESVNTLIDNGGTAPVALLGPTFSSRAQYEALSAQQPAVPFTVKNLWHTCDVITVRWESDQSPQPVVGISVLQTVFAPTTPGLPVPFQIKEIWGEFDSGAWLVNIGVFKPSKKARRTVVVEVEA